MEYNQNFHMPTVYGVSRREDDLYDVTVSLHEAASEEGGLPKITKVTVLEGWSAGEIFSKLKVRVPETEPDPNLSPEDRAIAILEEALQKTGSRTVITSTEMNDILLDARNAIGGKRNDFGTNIIGVKVLDAEEVMADA